MEKYHHPRYSQVYLFKRPNSKYWQVSFYGAGRNHRVSTKATTRAEAELFVDTWFLDLKLAIRNGEIKPPAKRQNLPTMKDASRLAWENFQTLIRNGQRSRSYVNKLFSRINHNILPLVEDVPVAEFGVRHWTDLKAELNKGKSLAPKTLAAFKNCILALLNAAHDHGLIDELPNLGREPHQTKAEKPRIWFDPDSLEKLDKALLLNIEENRGTDKERDVFELWAFVYFLLYTGLRPDEAMKVRFCDVTPMGDDTGYLIETIEGKRGYGKCRSDPDLRRIYSVIIDRVRPEPNAQESTQPLFAKYHRVRFNELLHAHGIKKDRFGRDRVFYSLRHTYLANKLLDRVPIYHVAKNCRTSVAMIEQHYARHLPVEYLDMAAVDDRNKPALKRHDVMYERAASPPDDLEPDIRVVKGPPEDEE